MRIWLPRTITGMVVTGGLLSMAPLLIAVLLAAVSLERLSHQSEVLIEEGLTVGRFGSDLRDELSNLDRNTRQYAALGDPALLEMIDRRWSEVEVTIAQFEQQRLDKEYAQNIGGLRRSLLTAHASWTSGLADPALLDGALGAVHTLMAAPDAIVASGRAQIDLQIEQLRRAAVNARRVMTVSVLALVPLAAVLILSFSTIVSQPFMAVSQAIASLGRGRDAVPLDIEYPREMKHLGRQIEWLRRRLAQLERDKERFLRHVSHELKTPLSSLHEGVALLQDDAVGELSPSQHEVVSILSESTAELGGLIDNLLAYAQWRHQRNQADAGWFDAREMAEEVLAAHRLSIQTRRLRVELMDRASRLFGQRPRLSEALDNLVSNAVKHAPEGSTIRLQCGIDGSTCKLTVADSGRGVPEAERRRIFQPFVRGSEPEESVVRGTGLGLSIVKETVLAHGGHVEVEDAQPGARFTLAWPSPPTPAA